jgi:hypothetical protein
MADLRVLPMAAGDEKSPRLFRTFELLDAVSAREGEDARAGAVSHASTNFPNSLSLA